MAAKTTGARKAAPTKAVPRNNVAPEQAVPQHNWQAEAEFWQLKYFEQLIHSTQIITALNRPMIGAVHQAQAAAQTAAANANGVAGQ